MKIERTLAEDIKGKMYLLKNGRAIREHRFKERWDRKRKMNEWKELVNGSESAEYIIKLRLDE